MNKNAKIICSCVCVFFKILFIYSSETQKERQRNRQREKQAPCRDPDVGLDPGPQDHNLTQPLSYPGAPRSSIFMPSLTSF